MTNNTAFTDVVILTPQQPLWTHKLFLQLKTQFEPKEKQFSHVKLIAGSVTGCNLAQDGNLKTSQFDTIIHLTALNNNELLVSDYSNNFVRKLNMTTGTDVVIAGEHESLRNPTGILVNHKDNFILICDSNNHCIRKLDLSTMRSTVFAGRVGMVGSQDGTLLHAKFNNPFGMCYDITGTKIYVCDFLNNQVRCIQDGTVTTVITMNDNKYIKQPRSIAMNPCNPSEYFLSCLHSILKLNMSTKQVTRVAGSDQQGYKDGEGHAALFHYADSIAIYKNSLLIADHGNNCIRKMDIQTHRVETFAGRGFKVDGGLSEVKLHAVFSVAVKNDDIYVSTMQTIKKIT